MKQGRAGLVIDSMKERARYGELQCVTLLEATCPACLLAYFHIVPCSESMTHISMTGGLGGWNALLTNWPNWPFRFA